MATLFWPALAGAAEAPPDTRLIALADGATLRLRPIRPDDEPRLAELFTRLSPQTVYQRFFRVYERLPPHWYRHFVSVDQLRRLALVAEEQTADGPLLRAVARCEPTDTPGTGEIAMVVEDAWQGRGLGTVLLEALLAAAEARGIERFTADVLADNHRILRVLARLADVRSRELRDGVLTLEFEHRRVAHDGLTAARGSPPG